MRGPVPLKSLNSSAEREQQRKNGTPRQVAHRNPRDSPIGETRVVKNNHNAKKTPTSPLNVKRFPSGPPLALSSSSAELTKKAQGIQGKNKENDDTPVKKLNQKKGGIGSKPCIMDDENDIQGLWSPPRPRNGAISRPPLGETNRQIQNQADATLSTTTTGKGGIKTKEARPRLKAKESLERLLAYKQMQEDDSTASKKTEEIPPVPALPSQIRSSTAQHPNQEEVQQKKMNDQDIPLTQAAVNADILDNNVKSTPEDTRGKTVKIKASFTGTLRGIMNSAVSGWTESLPTSISDKNTPTAISHPLSITSSISNSSRRVTILPSTYSSQQQQRSFDSTTRQKSVRKSKSMYISSPHIDGNSRIGRRESKDGAGGGGRSSSWIAMERERNSLILPTIIISDYTHD